MTDLWSEASRDLEAETAHKTFTAAQVTASQWWPFLSAAQSQTEYESRKAMVAERLASVVPDPKVRKQVLAAWDKDYAAIKPKRAAKGRTAANGRSFRGISNSTGRVSDFIITQFERGWQALRYDYSFGSSPSSSQVVVVAEGDSVAQVREIVQGIIDSEGLHTSHDWYDTSVFAKRATRRVANTLGQTFPCARCGTPTVQDAEGWGTLVVCDACDAWMRANRDPRSADEILNDWVNSLPSENVLDLSEGWLESRGSRRNRNATRRTAATVWMVPSDQITLDRVEAYLPRNYSATIDADGLIEISGDDSAGWTLEDYVIPRLGSGMMRVYRDRAEALEWHEYLRGRTASRRVSFLSEWTVRGNGTQYDKDYSSGRTEGIGSVWHIPDLGWSWELSTDYELTGGNGLDTAEAAQAACDAAWRNRRVLSSRRTASSGWFEDAGGLYLDPYSNQFGDYQVGNEYSRRFTKANSDGTFATVEYITGVIDGDEAYGWNDGRPFDVVGVTNIVVHTEPNDPWLTEINSDIIPDEPMVQSYATLEEAERVAENLCRGFSIDYIGWDGRLAKRATRRATRKTAAMRISVLEEDGKLLLFSGQFADTYEGEAVWNPQRKVYDVTLYDGRTFEVVTSGKRNNRNYNNVDATLGYHVNKALGDPAEHDYYQFNVV